MNDRRVVVVIEEDEEVRALLRATLGDAGFEVHFAATGESGIELVRAKRPDTVTLDVVLPDMNGYEVARRIREFSHTYIIILTARSGLSATSGASTRGRMTTSSNRSVRASSAPALTGCCAGHGICKPWRRSGPRRC